MKTPHILRNRQDHAARLTAVALSSIPFAMTAEAAEVTASGGNRYGQGKTQSTEVRGATIVAGWQFNVLREPTGSVQAWGRLKEDEVFTGVVQVSAGMRHVLGVKEDGTVVGWGSDLNGVSVVPADLPPAMAVAAGAFHSLALLKDGTVRAWGFSGDGRIAVPAGLRNVIAVAAGRDHSLALKSDGTVVAWGCDTNGQCKVPGSLSDVSAIAAGGTHSIVLTRDGSVVAWGGNEFGQTKVPAGLVGVTAIAAGLDHSLALKSDGTVAAWGNNSSGQLNLTGTGYTSISAGYQHSIGLRGGPVLNAQPQGGLFYGGSEVTLSAGTQEEGASFQWLLNGRAIPGATGRTLPLRNLTAAHAGLYSVQVTTAAGTTSSNVSPIVVRGRARTAIEMMDDGNPLVTVSDEFQQPITPALAEGYHLEVSDNLTDWRRSPSRPDTIDNGTLRFTDTREPGTASRFYRILQD